MAKIELEVMQTLRQAIDCIRPCGSCAACCLVLGVKELGKPYYQTCMHINSSPHGCCTTYNSRPESCQNFECAWRMSFLGNAVARRPDNLGLLFSVDTDSHGDWLDVFEIHAGAFAAAEPRLIDDTYRAIGKLGPLRGIRLYLYDSKIPTSYQIDAAYCDDGIDGRHRIYSTIDNIYFTYVGCKTD